MLGNYRYWLIILCLISGAILLPLSNALATPISCGQSTTGTISIPGEQDSYTFTGSTNDAVTIRLSKTTGAMQPSLKLYDPDMTLIGSAADLMYNNAKIDKTLPADGTYTIVAGDYGNNQDGEYILIWQRLNNPCNATSLTCGQSTAGSLSTTGEQDSYTFIANANDVVTIRHAGGGIQPSFDLYNSAGTIVASGSDIMYNNLIVNKTLTSGGTYTIIARAFNNYKTGNYTLTWQKLNDPCDAVNLSCGQLESTSLSIPGEHDFYTIDASYGYNVVLKMNTVSGGIDPYLELYDTTGSRIAYGYTTTGNFTKIDKILSSGGTHIVAAFDWGNTESGSYTLEFEKINNSCIQAAITAPNGGEFLESDTTITITWASGVSPGDISSQDITLSTDGGQTYPTTIASGLAPDVRSYDWLIPLDTTATNAYIRITVHDTVGGSNSDESDDDFIIFGSFTTKSQTYGYDNINRLTDVTYGDGTTTTYTYDKVGNRTGTAP